MKLHVQNIYCQNDVRFAIYQIENNRQSIINNNGAAAPASEPHPIAAPRLSSGQSLHLMFRKKMLKNNEDKLIC